ncbi:Mitogen-activated protein kinase 15-1 MPK15-1 [Gracilaria domingensis]|nr:Mitogen-activated protein kinase 15-1 MPK15-1 [Gracilaria domingensis]
MSLGFFGWGETTEPLDEREFAFERVRLSADEMRLEFIKEILAYHPEARDELLVGRDRCGRVSMLPSQAEQFRQDMEVYSLTRRTIGTDVSVVATRAEAAMRDYRSTTMSEAELARIDGAPAHHASSFANHAEQAMEE